MSSHDDQVHKIQVEIRNQLLEGLPVEFHIPGWKPIGLEDGFHWIKATIYEGYYLKFQVISRNGVNVVNMLKWEFEQDEPEFPA